jgi:tetratricopeptide (TPR) repeat protein
VYASYRLGGVYLRKGELERAVVLLERSHQQCQDWGFRALFPWTASLLGHAYALAGRLGEGTPLLEQALEQATATRFTTLQALWHTWLGEAYLAAGRLDEAAGLCRGALEVARQRDERGNEAYATRLAGDLAAHGDPADFATAEERFRRALALAEALAMRPLSAQCRLDLGRLARRRGLAEPARSELSEALRLFRGMAMPFWIARAEAELGGDANP